MSCLLRTCRKAFANVVQVQALLIINLAVCAKAVLGLFVSVLRPALYLTGHMIWHLVARESVVMHSSAGALAHWPCAQQRARAPAGSAKTIRLALGGLRARM